LVEKMFAEPEAEFSALLPASCNCKTLAMVKELASCLATFKPNRKRTNDNDKFNYLMGQMRRRCEGAAPIAELTKVVKTTLHVK